ncbi:hypothetical protein E1A91_A04G033100v1 [Gossypium mustelinum]|uniref:Uncharacterized protein n=1 Tax=Gossypium mustelinum TaxID=34275 RepID=A0A5D2ZLI8_GOSMU|nr:hypothetical protein E1A91_A04G033100v1 [Gossypium mustelinum]
MVVLVKFCNMYSCIWYSKLLVTYVNSSHVFLRFLVLLAGLANLSVTDCGSNDPDLKKEMEKQFVDLLTEELKLQEAAAEEHIHYMNITFGEAKRVASQYLREAEKCITAIETCKGARERAEALLIKERKVTTIWEQRARQMGWEGE